jgi:hypothetical protein
MRNQQKLFQSYLAMQMKKKFYGRIRLFYADKKHISYKYKARYYAVLYGGSIVSLAKIK